MMFKFKILLKETGGWLGFSLRLGCMANGPNGATNTSMETPCRQHHRLLLLLCRLPLAGSASFSTGELQPALSVAHWELGRDR